MYAAPIQRLVTELSKLPGVGGRTAQRLAFHLLRASPDDAFALADAIREVKEKVGLCEVCFNLAEGPRCTICEDARRAEMFSAAPISAAVASHQSHDHNRRPSPPSSSPSSGPQRRSTNSAIAANRRAAPAASARAQPSTAPTTAASAASGRADGDSESNICSP